MTYHLTSDPSVLSVASCVVRVVLVLWNVAAWGVIGCLVWKSRNYWRSE